MKSEHSNYQIPSQPGNYPRDFISKIETVFASPDSDIISIHSPERRNGIIISADIRNFTKTLEDNDKLRVQCFLSQFFQQATNLIHAIDSKQGFVNKLLGDGLFAHVKVDDTGQAIDIARNIVFIFNKYKREYNFTFANLSIAINKADYLIGSVGGGEYLDYTLLGSSVNSTFRMLSRTEGGLIWISREIRDDILHTHQLVYIGDMKFKGIVPRIPCYSIIRIRTEEEQVSNKKQECLENTCQNYHICRHAYDLGRKKAGEDENKYIFDLDCQNCGKENNQCWLWNNCGPKFVHANNHEGTTCCHMCKNFRNCFHCYQLGRRLDPMISCDVELLRSFI